MKITAKYLTKVYKDGTYALDDFSVNIESGEIVSVLGESGCGKTTLLRLLSGLEKPTAGELYFDDILYKDIPLKQRDTAVVFQEYILYPKMTVWENVAVALQRYGLPRAEEERRIYKVLTQLGLIKMRNQLPRVLSGGQQQRVALARAIVRKPTLLLFDEPLSNIEQEHRVDYIELIKQAKEQLPDATFIYVTHNPREAMAVGSKLLIMQDGKVLQYGEKERVWKNPYCADVLRTICLDYKETKGNFVSGVFSGDNGAKYNFDSTFNCPDASVIINPYDGNKPYIFDGKGEAICGEKSIVRFEGNFDGQTLKFCGTSFAVDEDFKMRFIGKCGNITVGIESIKFKTSGVLGDIKIPVEKCGKNFKAGNTIFYIYHSEGFDGAFYINPADINLFDGGRRVLAHYRVYKDSFKASGVEQVKRGGVRAICLAEENLGDIKLVYCIVRGYNHYLTFFVKPQHKFFGVKKLKLNL